MDCLLKSTMEYEKLKLEKSNVWICKKTVSLLWLRGCRTFTHWTGCKSCTLELLQWGPRTECATKKHPEGFLSVHGWGPVPEYTWNYLYNACACTCWSYRMPSVVFAEGRLFFILFLQQHLLPAEAVKSTHFQLSHNFCKSFSMTYTVFCSLKHTVWLSTSSIQIW